MKKIIIALATLIFLAILINNAEAAEMSFYKQLEESVYVPAISEHDWESDITFSAENQELNRKICTEYGIDEALSLALIYCESSFNEDAYHKNGNGTVDRGYYQVNSSNWKRISKLHGFTGDSRNLYLPEINIRCGLQILKEGVDKCGNTEEAIIYYNTGSSKNNSNAHTRRVMRYYEWFKERINEDDVGENGEG